MDREEISLIKSICSDSYYEFFIEFWHCIESEKLADNWHIKYLCDELQDIAERVIRREPLKHNLIINISPGETKSSISTIFFPVWVWLKDPSLRIITASYSKDLATEHSVKSRDLIRSDQFQAVFGDLFQVRKDIDGKTNYANNKGGQRQIASVGSTITGKHAHLLICLAGNQLVRTEKGDIEIRKIVEKRLNYKVLSFNHSTGKKEYKKILKWEKNPVRRMIKIETDSGKELICTDDHLIFTHNRGYVMAKDLTRKDVLEIL